MKWLHDSKILCERHHANVRVDVIAAGSTRVSVRFDRTLVNVSDTEHGFTLGSVIDEWGAPDWKSAIDTWKLLSRVRWHLQPEPSRVPACRPSSPPRPVCRQQFRQRRDSLSRAET